MKNNYSRPLKGNDLGGQFTSLDNLEMHNVKGGSSANPNPPLPPSGGVDFPLSLSTVQKIPVLFISVDHAMPAAASNAAVSFS